MTTTDVLVLDQQPEITDGLARAIRSAGRTPIVSNDVAAVRTVLERVPLSWILSPVSIRERFRYDGLELADDARRIAPGVRVLLYAHEMSEELAGAAARCGATALVPAPVSEETLRSWIRPTPTTSDCDPIHIPSLESVIEGDALTPYFQPIVALHSPGGAASVHGHESLARYRGAAPFVDCEFLFRYAERDHRVCELDLACVARSIRRGAELARGGKLFINLHPRVLTCSDLDAVLHDEAARASVPLENVVLEITERERVADVEAAAACVERLRPHGVSFALDDVGSAYSHLELLGRIAPSYLKISPQFGTGFERDPVKRKIVRNLVALAGEFDCQVILEGIETPETARAACDLGIRFGQGFHFAPPTDIGVEQLARDADAIARNESAAKRP